jgi:hypothetical protein
MSEPEWTRPPARAPHPAKPARPLTMFYGYPAEVIAEWCAISVATARRCKAGKRKPSPSVERLFTLHRDRRVLGPSWRGWLVKPDSIVDPDGNETGRMQLYNYFWVVQFARHLAAERSERTRSSTRCCRGTPRRRVPKRGKLSQNCSWLARQGVSPARDGRAQGTGTYRRLGLRITEPTCAPRGPLAAELRRTARREAPRSSRLVRTSLDHHSSFITGHSIGCIWVYAGR